MLILDDPTQGLDAVARRILFEELVTELADAGTTVLLTTHDLAGVESIAQKVGILGRCRLLVDEPLEDLKARFRRLAFRSGDTEAWKGLKPISVARQPWGTEVVIHDYSETDGECGASEVLPMSLEEIFTAVAESNEGGVS